MGRQVGRLKRPFAQVLGASTRVYFIVVLHSNASIPNVRSLSFDSTLLGLRLSLDDAIRLDGLDVRVRLERTHHLLSILDPVTNKVSASRACVGVFRERGETG